ncbi:BON domain-containing protein [Pseudomonadales bacterium]|nr:BON domain-containing protein [Pseudomonadales bacterium]MDA9297744.1 BON domain-containing protein [Pseudomonadales bacterium]MDA9315865.1 BON domain-containing protein [Pseudomonadales bacterium]MDB9867833.1 BON domain-containing protein [Pseudomonadales bacterium]MDB9917984.1 BON domain-containing protein [Pseudomonadales bacterium]
MTLPRTLLVLIMTTTLLSSCIAVVAGGAAAGGYMMGNDERSVGQITDDATITAAIKTRLIRERAIKSLNINVDTYLQVVTLRGKVSSASQEQIAIKIAQEVKGVKQVISELNINPVEVQDRQ